MNHFYNLMKLLCNVIFRIPYRLHVHGRENIILNEKLIVCSNHTNILDPVIIAMIFPRQISFMAKKELFENAFVGALARGVGAFPVDRKETDITAIKNALRILKNDGVLGIFPEGTRVKSFDLENVKSGTAMIGVKSKSRILPIYIEGSYKFFSRIDIYIGKPMDFSEYYDKRIDSNIYDTLSKEVLTNIYSIKGI